MKGRAMKPVQGKDLPEQQARKRWEPPVVEKVGAVGDVLKGGGGKLSVVGGDPGDQRKPSGGGE
jgi:hypothetical protein